MRKKNIRTCSEEEAYETNENGSKENESDRDKKVGREY